MGMIRMLFKEGYVGVQKEEEKVCQGRERLDKRIGEGITSRRRQVGERGEEGAERLTRDEREKSLYQGGMEQSQREGGKGAFNKSYQGIV